MEEVSHDVHLYPDDEYYKDDKYTGKDEKSDGRDYGDDNEDQEKIDINPNH